VIELLKNRAMLTASRALIVVGNAADRLSKAALKINRKTVAQETKAYSDSFYAFVDSAADPARQQVSCGNDGNVVWLSIATADGAVTKALMTPQSALALSEWLGVRAIAARIEDGGRDPWETA
jgi:hypothetical protein